MSTKHRDAIFQHWRSVITRESRDLASLEQTAGRAFADSDVRADPTLESMIRAEVAERRVEFTKIEPPPEQVSPPSEPERVQPPDQVDTSMRLARDAQAAFNRLGQDLRASVARGDQAGARACLERMRIIQADSPQTISLGLLEPYERDIAQLAKHFGQMKEQIAALTQQTVATARRGDGYGVVQLLRRLTSLHASYPALLDETQLDQIRHDVIHASEHEAHRMAARKLVERERAVATELHRLAEAVHAFHQAAQAAPHGSRQFLDVEAKYRKAADEVRAHDPNWLAGLVLELADLLAEWGDPQPEAEQQVDRFVDRIRAMLSQIRTELRSIENEQGDSKAT